MAADRRATFSKVVIENGKTPKTVYAFRLERYHWLFGIFASIAAVIVCLIILRGAVYASVRDVAGDEFQTQLEVFHSQAQPAIRALIEDRIELHRAASVLTIKDTQHAAALATAENLNEIAVSLAGFDQRLKNIEKTLEEWREQ